MKQNQVSAYDLNCGGVQKDYVNDCWIELYREHNCYHVRMGRNGEKWSRWETFDNTFESPLKCARSEWTKFKKLAKLGKVYPLKKCNQCDSATINGVYCHEKGCYNENKIWDSYEGEWIENIEEDDDYGYAEQVNFD